MKYQQRALTHFRPFTDSSLLSRAVTVYLTLKDHPFFSDPDPGIAVLKEQLDDFGYKLGICHVNGGKMDTVTKNLSRRILEDILKSLANYVNRKAKEDPIQLLDSGFVLSSSNQQRKDVPLDVKQVRLLRTGKPGALKFSFEKNREALIYEYRYGVLREKEETIWTEPLPATSTRRNVIADLLPFKTYQLQVRAVNGKGRSPWSEAVSCRVV